MTATTFDQGEVVVLDGQAYLRRLAYFMLTTVLVVVGSAIAVQQLILSPWDALYVLPVAFAATALGANTGYHMYFTHRTFTTHRFIRGFLALLGTLLCQDSVVQWVANHKRHHRHVDIVDRDPHTPRQFGDNRLAVLTVGLWWASMGWKFDRVLTAKKFYAGQLLDEPMLKWFDKHFIAISYAGFAFPFALGWAIGGQELAIKWFAYFGAFRVFVGYFFTEFVVNGLCHSVGSSKFKTKGRSTNLVFMSSLTLGATLHHNHHAFPRVLSPAVDKEFDPMKLLYWALHKLGVIALTPGPTPDEVNEKRLHAPKNVLQRAVKDAVMKVAAFNRNRMAGQGRPNLYLTGVHRPMEVELTLENLPVSGLIPPELDGRYLRIGPNPLGKQNQAAYHWFVGDGMVHGVRIQGGKALWYRNRWVRTTEVSRALGETPAPGPRKGGGAGGMVNTNVIPHAGKIWALVEANNYPVELDEELETVAHNPFEGTLLDSFSAHPHRDPDTGELHAICYSVFDPKRIRHVVVGKDGKVRREEPIAVQHGPKIHECMITPSFVLVFDLPVTFSLGRVLAGHIFPYTWNAKHRARVGLMPVNGSAADIMWCDVSPCHVFHACNACDGPGGEVIVDVVVHDSMFAEKSQGPISKKVTFERWFVDPVVKRVTRQVIDNQPQEYPRMDERRVGKPYRYAYTTSVADHGLNFLSATFLIKHDLKTRTKELHDFGEGRFPGEFVFVPKHAAAAEDEGWLMGFVVNEAEDTTDLAILDAQQFSAQPQALIRLPHRVPPGLHGSWVTAK